MSHEGDSVAEVYDERRRLARRPYPCAACGDTIAAGQAYIRVFIVCEGDKWQIKRCLRCQKIHEHLRKLCAEEGSYRWPDEALACGEDYEENWGKSPPDEIAALAFALPGEVTE